MRSLLLVTALLIAATGPATGSPVYRCPGDQGAITFTDEPCPGGERVQLPEPPPAGAAAAARERAEALAESAEALAEARRAREAGRERRAAEQAAAAAPEAAGTAPQPPREPRWVRYGYGYGYPPFLHPPHRPHPPKASPDPPEEPEPEQRVIGRTPNLID